MNEVILIGRLARDPEIRYTQTQMAVCTFSLAVDRSRKNENPNAPTADFIRITVWNKAAENCSRYLHKGSQAAVHGRIQTGSYTNRDGQKVYTTDVIAQRVEFLGSRSDNANSYPQNEQGYPQQNDPQRDVPRDDVTGKPVPPATPSRAPPGFESIDEDDIPF